MSIFEFLADFQQQQDDLETASFFSAVWSPAAGVEELSDDDSDAMSFFSGTSEEDGAEEMPTPMAAASGAFIRSPGSNSALFSGAASPVSGNLMSIFDFLEMPVPATPTRPAAIACAATSSTAGKSAAGSQGKSATVFGTLASRAAQAASVSGIDTASFLAAAQAYREFLAKSTVPKFFLADFDGNYELVQAFYAADPARRGTLAELCAAKGCPEPKVSWLLWGMEYFTTVLQRLWQADKQAGLTAYDLTLSKHHTRAQRFLARPFLRLLPSSKDAICSLEALMLEPADAWRAYELIDREAALAVRTLAPALRTAIDLAAAAFGAAA